MARLIDWPERLNAVVESFRGTPYVLGQNDCLRLACAAVAACTGIDYWPRIVGKRGYKTKRQALVTIAKIAPSLGEAVTATLGVAPSPTLSAQRGDILLYRDAGGEDHLGVCIGRTVVLMAESGTLQLRLDDAGLLCAWRVG